MKVSFVKMYQMSDCLCIPFLEITLSTIVPRHEGKKRDAEKSHARDDHGAGMSNDTVFAI